MFRKWLYVTSESISLQQTAQKCETRNILLTVNQIGRQVNVRASHPLAMLLMLTLLFLQI